MPPTAIRNPHWRRRRLRCGAALLACVAVCALARPAHAQLEEGYPQTFGFHYLHFEGSVHMSYIVYVPQGYDGHAPRPLIIFMHGAGECGTDWGALFRLGVAGELHGNPKMQDGFESLVMCPQCPPHGERWDQPAVAQAVVDLIAQTCEHWRVEMDRVYITGLSMGAKGACTVAALAPKRFAGIAPFSLDGFMPNMDVLSQMAVWNVSGDADPPSLKIAQAVDAEMQKRGGVVHSHYVPGARHTAEAWVDYANPEMYKWLLEHRRAGAAVARGGVPGPADGLTVKILSGVVRQIQTATRYKPILDHLGVLAANSKNADEVAEAKDLLARVDQWAADELAQAKDLEGTAPGDAQTVYRFLNTRMAGTPSGAAADERLKDKGFADNVAAWASYERMLAAEKSIRETPDAKTVADPKFVAINRIYLDALKEVGRGLQKTYPNTVACREAQKILTKYGIAPAGT